MLYRLLSHILLTSTVSPLSKPDLTLRQLLRTSREALFPNNHPPVPRHGNEASVKALTPMVPASTLMPLTSEHVDADRSIVESSLANANDPQFQKPSSDPFEAVFDDAAASMLSGKARRGKNAQAPENPPDSSRADRITPLPSAEAFCHHAALAVMSLFPGWITKLYFCSPSIDQPPTPTSRPDRRHDTDHPTDSERRTEKHVDVHAHAEAEKRTQSGSILAAQIEPEHGDKRDQDKTDHDALIHASDETLATIMQVESMLQRAVGESYTNRWVVFSIIDRLLARLIPELLEPDRT
jgi:hypothetical protein